jgi:fibronectin-binding autotransporter adhesin
VNFNNGVDQTAGNTITGTGGLTKTAGGVLTLASAANNYAGGTTITGGTLRFGVNNALPTAGAVAVNGGGQLDIGTSSGTVGDVTLAGGAITASGGTLTGNIFNVQSGTISATLAGTSPTTGLTKTTDGTVVLAAANVYGGLTDIQGGSVQLTADAIPHDVQISGGANLDLQTSTAHIGTLSLIGGTVTGSGTLSGAAYNVQSGTISATLGNNGSALVKSGTGTVVLQGTNSYGGTTIGNGVLAIGAANNLGVGGLTLDAGTLETTGHVTLDATHAVTLTNAAAGIDVLNTGDTTTLVGQLTGTGGLNKTGQGALALASSGAIGNDYYGATNVAAGTLLAESENALSANSALVIADGASVILDFGGASGNALAIPTAVVPSFAAPAMIGAPALGSPLAVPEPGTLVLLLVATLGGCGLWLGRRGR